MRYVLRTALIAMLFAGACGTTRSAAQYRDDTARVIETRSGAVSSCYDEVLESEAGASGTVVVTFKVEPKTGRIVDPVVDDASAAPARLGQCVVDALDGLAIEPPDKKAGHATFSWRFEAGT